MKIEMDAEHIRQRFERVRELRRLCLSLARSSAGHDVIRRCQENEKVRRTSRALGH
ncbi:MAG: hypothetical protein U0527_05470 [Candidatus Eisenbacteria bacterium]